MLNIHSIETFGTHEGPGIRLVIFTQGCNARCLYCHNADTQTTKGGRSITADEIITLLKKERAYFSGGGGVTFSGGEPTLQVDALIPICRQIKEAGFNIALDTNGTMATKSVKELYDLCDLILLDVKQIDDTWHRKITGVSNKGVLRMVKYREESGKPIWLRYVLVPGYSDQPSYLEAWGQHFKNYKMIERVEILPYHTLGAYKYKELGLKYPLAGVPTPTKEEVEKAGQIFGKYFKSVFVR